MVKTIYSCDRCGQVIENDNYYTLSLGDKNGLMQVDEKQKRNHIELCRECVILLNKFIDEAKFN